MHELATSRSIAELVLGHAQQRGAKRVLSVEVEIGKLTFLNPDQVDFWIQTSFQGTVAEGAKLKLKLIEPLVVCQTCGYQGPLPVEEDPLWHFSFPSLQCPRCSSATLTVERGRECTLRRIQLLCQ